MSHTARISELVDQRKDVLVGLSRQIWEFAELRYEEYRSAELLCQALETEGFSVERKVGGIETAFVATAGNGGPVIGFLGEYDALPGLSQKACVAKFEPLVEGGNGHGCGHNLLGVGALAAAVALRDYLKEKGLPGTVKYFGCPAEEGGGGKVRMAAAGVFNGVDVALTWHPSYVNYVFSSSTLATQTLTFRFRGRSAHAAMSPHLGRSALDAVELTNVGANYLREHIPGDARVHYAIIDTGGVAPNVVQAHAAVRYQIRSPKAAQVKDVTRRVCNIARGAALMTETELEIEEGAAYLNVIPNTTIEAVMHRNLEQLGLPAYDEKERAFAREIRATLSEEERKVPRFPEIAERELADRISPYRPLSPLSPISTDVGDVTWLVPTAQYRGATWAVGTQAHTWQVVAQGVSSFAHKGMLHAGKVMAATGVDVVTCPELIEKAKAELHQALTSGLY